MKRDLPDRELRAVLHDDETVVAQGRASITPRSSRDVVAVEPLFFIGGLVDRWTRRVFEAADIAEETESTSFPLEPHMVAIVTTERILTWSRDRDPGNPETVLANVPFEQIDSINTEIPRLGSGMDARITMKDGLQVRIRVDHRLADVLVSSIRHRLD